MTALSYCAKTCSDLGKRPMIELWHCPDTRSFRPLWALEELGLPYELHLLAFQRLYRVGCGAQSRAVVQ